MSLFVPMPDPLQEVRRPVDTPRTPPTAPTDEDLVQRALRSAPGDGRAFAELLVRHGGHVRANCRYLLGDEMDADDVAQDVFVRAYFSLRTFEARSTFKTWIRRIKVNRCLDVKRARTARVMVDVDDPVMSAPQLRVEPTAPGHLRDDDLRSAIDRVLVRMPESLRVPLVLRDMDGLSYAEIAERLDLGDSAVKMRIKRARAYFRSCWDRENRS